MLNWKFVATLMLSQLIVLQSFAVGALRQKIVGVTIDYRKNEDGANNFAKGSFYATRDNYISSFQKSCKKYNIIVVPIPLDTSMIERYTSGFDGIVFTGNYYDVNPALYNQSYTNKAVNIKDETKTRFEIELFKRFYKTKKPVFGICGGYQAINVALGGELYQDIPSEVQSSTINHSSPGKICAHEVKVEGSGNQVNDNSVFAKYLKDKKASSESLICVNSTHHQAVSKLAKSLRAAATAPDGIIEAYENPSHPFLVGVQWHPEYEWNNLDLFLIDEFCKSVARPSQQAEE